MLCWLKQQMQKQLQGLFIRRTLLNKKATRVYQKNYTAQTLTTRSELTELKKKNTGEKLVGTSGIEPPTTTMSRWCSTTNDDSEKGVVN